METIKFARKEQYGLERWYPQGDTPAVRALHSLTNHKCFTEAQLAKIGILGVNVVKGITTATGFMEIK